MGLNVLIVDDSELARCMLSNALTVAGVETETLYEARDGQEGLAVLGDHEVDVMFVDLNMPVMDGVEMINRLGNLGTLDKTPIVVTTAAGSEERISDLRAKGAKGYLAKPYTLQMVRDALEFVLGSGYGGRTTSDVLEQDVETVVRRLAKAFSEPIDKARAPQPHDPLWLVAVPFTGPIEGRLSMAMPGEMGNIIAENMLDDLVHKRELNEDIDKDAAKEMVNVLCGSVLSTLTGVRSPSRPTPPELTEITQSAWNALVAEPSTVAFMVDDLPVLVHLTVTFN